MSSDRQMEARSKYPHVVSNWRQYKLGDLTEWASGGTPNKQVKGYWDGSIPWISAASMKTIRLDNSERKITPAGLANGSRLTDLRSVLLLVRGSELHKRIPVGMAMRQLAFNQDVKAIKAKDGLLPEFLLYWFLGHERALLEKVENTGIGAGKLDTDVMKNLPISLPSLSEQRAIAHILGTLDDKIELNRRMNETLEAMARALFKSWFVDFDPVRAKAEGRDPGLPKEIADLFPNSFQDSELGEIPKGWGVAPLPSLIEVNPSRKLRKGEIAPYLDMANMPTSGHRASGWIEREFGSGMKFMNGDTLIARITPCLENGKTAFVDFLEDGQVGWGSTEYIVLRSKPPLPDAFSYLLARSEEFRSCAIQNMTGTSGRQRVPATCFDNYLLVASSDTVAFAFGKAIDSLMHQIKANSEHSDTLAKIRDTLLPKLLSGETTVRDAQKFVGTIHG